MNSFQSERKREIESGKVYFMGSWRLAFIMLAKCLASLVDSLNIKLTIGITEQELEREFLIFI